MTISDEFEPIPRRHRGWLSAICYGLLAEATFTLAGSVFGAMLALPGQIDGWFFWHAMLFGGIGALIGVPFAILTVAAVRWLD